MSEGIQDKARVYFPGLNGLRFWAAFAVILTHLELLKGQLNLPSLWHDPPSGKAGEFFFYAGGLGVYFFFVLSGFLITYLLLAEKKQTGTIGIKDFYLRRVFRIWPLYYLIVLLAFFVLPKITFLHLPYFQKFIPEHFETKLALYCLLLPNVALAMFKSIPHAGQTWSIGVEEQFYIIWPWMVKKAGNLVKAVLVFTSIVLVCKAILLVMYKLNPDNPTLRIAKEIAAMSKFESMSIGALGAIVLFENQTKLLNLLYSRGVQIICYLLLLPLIWYTPAFIQDGIHIVFSLIFLIIILNVCSNPKTLFTFTNPAINYLGKISYGIYMYHMVCIVICIQACKTLIPGFNASGLAHNAVLYGSSILVTILISAISYELFEKYFIRKKQSFSKIESGDSGKN